jgi:hypothetical protein
MSSIQSSKKRKIVSGDNVGSTLSIDDNFKPPLPRMESIAATVVQFKRQFAELMTDLTVGSAIKVIVVCMCFLLN